MEEQEEYQQNMKRFFFLMINLANKTLFFNALHLAIDTKLLLLNFFLFLGS